mmetsp:Transcript_45586/g.108374  ORF Transcript_45586/g.108374 Transcript_45586/m.108374 type:complete len:209 (+) Transcript_45586:652-1278(+)
MPRLQKKWATAKVPAWSIIVPGALGRKWEAVLRSAGRRRGFCNVIWSSPRRNPASRLNASVIVEGSAETPEARATAGARFRRFLRTSAELCSTIWKTWMESRVPCSTKAASSSSELAVASSSWIRTPRSGSRMYQADGWTLPASRAQGEDRLPAPAQTEPTSGCAFLWKTGHWQKATSPCPAPVSSSTNRRATAVQSAEWSALLWTAF